MDDQEAVKVDLQRRSGRRLAGVFAFGDSDALNDELLAFVTAGTKRATAGALDELETSVDPFPAPGMHWGLLDGRGEGRFVMETTEVRVGRLDSVDPSFAWDEGEYDRTLEDWLEGHRRYFSRQGVADPDALEVVFERFRIVWPKEDEVTWLAEGVREAGIDDRAWISMQFPQQDGERRPEDGMDATGLPALIAERDGVPVGLLRFRPQPGGIVRVAAIETTEHDTRIAEALETALGRLADQTGWSEILRPSSQ